MNQGDKLNPVGFLEIFKLYDNGGRELIWSDFNTITSGMGVGLGVLFAGTGSQNILDFQLRYFQLGISGTTNYGVSTYQLGSSIPVLYLSGGDLAYTSSNSQIKNGTTFTSQPFCVITQSNIQKASPTSVRYHIVIPNNSLNNLLLPINEIGLFMQNPFGLTPHTSILVAYKYFSNIVKTDQFALLFRWTIQF